jgi:OHCU decarboxylase
MESLKVINMPQLPELNTLSKAEVDSLFFQCCGSKRWTERMRDSRPFESQEELFSAAEKVWKSLNVEDWLEAFSCHPRIGARIGAKIEARIRANLEQGHNLTPWAVQEQAGVIGATENTLNELFVLNQKYEEKFGHVFLVCATGKTADEMLNLLKARIENNSSQELKIAMNEQSKITQIRLEKLLNS